MRRRRRMKGWRDGAGAAAAGGSFVPHCVVWITRSGEIAPNKSGTGKGHWRVPFSSSLSLSVSYSPRPLLPLTHPPMSCRWVLLPLMLPRWNEIPVHGGSQVSWCTLQSSLFLTKSIPGEFFFSFFFGGGGACKVTGLNCSEQQARPRYWADRMWELSSLAREKTVSEKAIWVLMKPWWMSLRPRQQ